MGWFTWCSTSEWPMNKIDCTYRSGSCPRTGRKHEKCNGQWAMVSHESAALQNKRNPSTKSTQADLNRNTEPTFAHVRHTELHEILLSTGPVGLFCRIQNNAWAIRIPQYFQKLFFAYPLFIYPLLLRPKFTAVVRFRSPNPSCALSKCTAAWGQTAPTSNATRPAAAPPAAATLTS